MAEDTKKEDKDEALTGTAGSAPPDLCPMCKGSGMVMRGRYVYECDTCGGEGYVND